MGGFFGAACKYNVIDDVFFGTDYHSHLGTRRGGMAVYDPVRGLQRDIHNIENSPFRTKFEKVFEEMTGCSAIGCISDYDPQPLLIRSKLGVYAICVVGFVNNAEELIDQYLTFSGGHFNAMTAGNVNGTELVAALINQKNDFVEGLRFAQSEIQGTANILILKGDGTILAARDRLGRLPVSVGKREDGYCVSTESFVCEKVGYERIRELGPGEIVSITPDGVEQLAAAGKEMRFCSFMWSYYGFPTSTYEGVNVEVVTVKSWLRTMLLQEMQKGLIMLPGFPIPVFPMPLDMQVRATFHMQDLLLNIPLLGPAPLPLPVRATVRRSLP